MNKTKENKLETDIAVSQREGSWSQRQRDSNRKKRE